MVEDDTQIYIQLESRINAQDVKLDDLISQMSTLTSTVDSMTGILTKSIEQLLKSFGVSGEETESLIFEREEEETESIVLKDGGNYSDLVVLNVEGDNSDPTNLTDDRNYSNIVSHQVNRLDNTPANLIRLESIGEVVDGVESKSVVGLANFHLIAALENHVLNYLEKEEDKTESNELTVRNYNSNSIVLDPSFVFKSEKKLKTPIKMEAEREGKERTDYQWGNQITEFNNPYLSISVSTYDSQPLSNTNRIYTPPTTQILKPPKPPDFSNYYVIHSNFRSTVLGNPKPPAPKLFSSSYFLPKILFHNTIVSSTFLTQIFQPKPLNHLINLYSRYPAFKCAHHMFDESPEPVFRDRVVVILRYVYKGVATSEFALDIIQFLSSGNTKVPGEIIQGVISCWAPPLPRGNVTICITS